MSLHQLPSATVKLISSAQVITSVSSVIKELMENSLDAGASNLEVKLDDHGLGRIEVKDNGLGVAKHNVEFMCQKSYTSKISNFEDLNKLNTYGFRGEALSSLCSVSKVSVTTITEADDLATTFEFDTNGIVTSTKISHIIKGTSVVIENLFKNLPVRKQYLTNGRRKMEEIKKVEHIVKSLAVIHPKLRVVLTHNKFCIWQKNSVSNLRQSLVQVIAPTVVKQLKQIIFTNEKVSFEMLIPAIDCNVESTCYKYGGETTLLFINLRPIKDNKIEKIVQEEIFNYFGHSIPSGKCPTFLLSILIPPDSLDVNLEPNKTKVILKEKDEIGNIIKNQLAEYYIGPLGPRKDFLDAIDEEVEKTSLKRKLDENEETKNKLAKISEEVSQIQFMEDADSEIDDLECSNKESDINSFLENVIDEKKTSLPIRLNGVDPNREDVIASFLDGIIAVKPHDELMENKSPDGGEQSNNGNLYGESSFETDNIPQPEGLNINSITLSQWSRGEVKLGTSTVNSTTVILGKDESSKEKPTSIVNVDVFSQSGSKTESQLSISSAERSVSSQMGCKDMAGFTKYASEMTNKIAQGDSKGISFTKVASELANKWRELQDNEKEQYNERAKVKIDKKEKETKANSSMQNCLQNFLAKSNEKRVLKKRSYPKELKLNSSLSSLKKLIDQRVDLSEANPFNILGELNEDLKCASINTEMYIFSIRRLEEALLFHRHLRSMIIPLKVLESNINLTAEEVGDSLWAVLISLETAIDVKSGTIIISDNRITGNGLRIECTKEADSQRCSFQITDVPLHIAFYGLDDLKEILSLIQSQAIGACSSLEDCRPLKIISYIRAETIRFISKNHIDNDGGNPAEKFNYWLTNVKQNNKRCPHQKSVYKKVNLKDFMS